MPTIIEQKLVDPEAELSNVQRLFKKLSPMCSVEKRGGGIPQLAPQEKQLGILAHELRETLLCIELATKGLHALRDSQTKNETLKCIVDYENLESVLRDERAQQQELDCLNYLAQKMLIELIKQLPSEADELAMIENASSRLRRMENRLDLATKRFCVVNTNNKQVRHDINRLMVERENFNAMWNRTINKLVMGKEYLMDIFEIANSVFANRDECCRKLEALKWKGLFELNKDIAEMQYLEGDLNHLAKLEEFLRVKGSTRICEADEIEEMKRHEEIQRCESEIKRHDALLEEIFTFAETEQPSTLISRFNSVEIQNFSIFVLLSEVLQESVLLRREVATKRQQILDQQEINQSRDETQVKRIEELQQKCDMMKASVDRITNLNEIADTKVSKVIKGIDELIRLSRSNVTPLLSLLGNHKEVTIFNVRKFLRILETEVLSLVEVVYGAVKPPAPTPSRRKGAPAVPVSKVKLVADPHIQDLRPNRIEKLIPYLPCAYCVEDYIMNLVFETPAVPADKTYVQEIFRLEPVNTKFGIYTLTNPDKRHPYMKKE